MSKSITSANKSLQSQPLVFENKLNSFFIPLIEVSFSLKKYIYYSILAGTASGSLVNGSAKTMGDASTNQLTALGMCKLTIDMRAPITVMGYVNF